MLEIWASSHLNTLDQTESFPLFSRGTGSDPQAIYMTSPGHTLLNTYRTIKGIYQWSDTTNYPGIVNTNIGILHIPSVKWYIKRKNYNILSLLIIHPIIFPLQESERTICGSQMNFGKRTVIKSARMFVCPFFYTLTISIAYYSKYHLY